MSVQSSAEGRRQQLAALDEAITERKQYYREQEVLIADMIDSGNTQLMGLNYEITEATQVLKDLKVAIRTQRQDKVLLNEDLAALRLELSQLAPALG